MTSGSDTTRLWLGESIDDAGKRTGTRVSIDPDDLTTHGVVVGMTGSGKTGLGIVLLEEVLLQGIPALILDPKGDMGNLLLRFPALAPADFAPWVEAADADDADTARRTADDWRDGLADWGIDGARLERLATAADFRIYTPGSNAGTPLSVLGSLQPPDDADAEATADEIESFVSGLLTLVGRTADPVAGRDHILLSNLIARSWNAGAALDLAALVTQVVSPPFRKLGVFELDTFIPPSDRMQLAVELNALLAAPAFATWLQGDAIDMDAMLRAPDGRPRAAIVHLAHLSDAERQFIVTLVLSRLVSWMRRQPGTSSLRTLVYMDEVYGFAPPTAAPPAKKPILTILKQARAHGVGMVLATQNPVDLDYKAMSNAGTWMIGRLQTERDRDRILDGMRAASGDTDARSLASAIGSLGKRQFLLHTSRGGAPVRFTTRWAMSYLRGPLTRTEIERLAGAESAAADAPAHAPSHQPAPARTHTPTPSSDAPADDETRVPPAPPAFVPVRYLDPAAPWAADVGARAGGRRLEPCVAARVRLRFDDRAADVDHAETWECVWHPLGRQLRAEDARTVDYDDRDLQEHAPHDVAYVVSDADLASAAFYRDAERDLREWLYRERRIDILHNPELGLYARVGEGESAFRERCTQAADDAADAETAKLRDRYETSLARLQQRQRDAERRIGELDVDVRTRSQHELLAGAGTLISMFLRGGRSTRGLSGIASRRSTTRRTQERLESARGRADDIEREIDDLEQELAADVQAIHDRFDAAASRIEQRTIPLDKSDIDVDPLVLLWIPT